MNNDYTIGNQENVSHNSNSRGHAELLRTDDVTITDSDLTKKQDNITEGGDIEIGFTTDSSYSDDDDDYNDESSFEQRTNGGDSFSTKSSSYLQHPDYVEDGGGGGGELRNNDSTSDDDSSRLIHVVDVGLSYSTSFAADADADADVDSCTAGGSTTTDDFLSSIHKPFTFSSSVDDDDDDDEVDELDGYKFSKSNSSNEDDDDDEEEEGDSVMDSVMAVLNNTSNKSNGNENENNNSAGGGEQQQSNTRTTRHQPEPGASISSRTPPSSHSQRRPTTTRSRNNSRDNKDNDIVNNEDDDIESPTIEAELVSNDCKTNLPPFFEHNSIKSESDELKKQKQPDSPTELAIKEEEEDPTISGRLTRTSKIIIAILFLMLLAGIIVSLVILVQSSKDIYDGSNDGNANGETNSNSNGGNNGGPTNSPHIAANDGSNGGSGNIVNTVLLQPTLQTIQERGYINCRVETVEKEQGHGLSLDLCRALSAAIFRGDPDRVEYPYCPWRENFLALHTGKIDVTTSQATFNMNRDVYEYFSHKSQTFSTPWLISGIGFGGIPQYVDCAENADTLSEGCRDLVLCSLEASTNNVFVRDHFDGSATVHISESGTDQFDKFIAGECNVIVGQRVSVYEQRAREAGYTGEYRTGEGTYSMEPLAIVSRGDDPEWADFTNSVLQALITAEQMNISPENVHEFPQTMLFGEDFQDMFRYAIRAVGNWGQMYERSLQERFARDGVNLLTPPPQNNDEQQSGGLLFVPPFGNLDFNPDFATDIVPQRVTNGTLESIDSRGKLRCGVLPDRPGFAVLDTSVGEGENPDAAPWWDGMDADLCRALAAATLGDSGQVEFIYLADEAAGFFALDAGAIDVYSGAPYTLQNDVKEPRTGKAFTFSPVYYYGQDENGDDGVMLAMATSQDDPQWGDFVRWVLYSLIYAEQKDFGSGDVNKMPSVDLFGPSYQLMFRLALLHVGNYADLYERNLEELYTRSGYNLLNDGSTPLIHPLPIEMFR